MFHTSSCSWINSYILVFIYFLLWTSKFLIMKPFCTIFHLRLLFGIWKGRTLQNKMNRMSPAFEFLLRSFLLHCTLYMYFYSGLVPTVNRWDVCRNGLNFQKKILLETIVTCIPVTVFLKNEVLMMRLSSMLQTLNGYLWWMFI